MSLKFQRFRGINERREYLKRFDRIIQLLEEANKKPPLLKRILNGAATGVGILGIITVVDIIKGWIGG